MPSMGDRFAPLRLEVAFLFNVYDRLADAMAWDVPPQAGGYYQVAARRLLKRGYV